MARIWVFSTLFVATPQPFWDGEDVRSICSVVNVGHQAPLSGYDFSTS